MTFCFTEEKKVKFNMYGYVEKMINEFPIKISNIDTSLTPDGNNIFFKDNRKSIGKKKISILQ